MTYLILGGVLATILAGLALLLRTEHDAGAQEATASIETKAQARRIEALEHSRKIAHEIDRGTFSDTVDAL